MRVIAGSARGTRLGRVPAGTRPLSDRAREGLFSHLGSEVAGARWLDLYAGTGAVGIEALSRGAASCVFVDGSARAIRTIRDNLSKTRLEDRGRVLRADVTRFLDRPSDERFDVAFLDPPYTERLPRLRALLEKVGKRVEPGGAIVLTRPSGDDTDVIPVDWHVAKLLVYGDSHVLVCREGA
ncbi:MAG: 16S rRNA (guanine(966)-N(2))-methyltransferase RsmD [Actinomycetota bacterium]